jgi:putative endonuclease
VKRDKTGRFGETLARLKLLVSGYRIIETNYRTKGGEIDIIAKDRGELIFIEVKTKRSEDYGKPEEAVDQRKREKLSQLATAYISEKNLFDMPARFDVVAVDLAGIRPKIKIIRDAFESTL